MQVSVENTSAIARRITVEIAGNLIQSEVSKRLKAAVSNAKVNGFRPGKVSKATEKRYEGSVLQDIIWEKLEQALKEKNIVPAGHPASIEPEEFVRGKDWRFVVDLDVFPAEIELKDYAEVEVTKPEHELTDEDVQEMVLSLRKQASTFKEVDQAAKNEDRIIMDFVGKLDGEPFEGGSAKEHALVLGSKQMIPGFEEALIGVKKGEERTFKVTFPEDYQAENLAGKETEFTVNVSKVEELELAPLDDTLFKRYGMAEGDADKFMAEIRKNMQRELNQAIKSKVKNQVFSALLKMYDMDLPRSWVMDEAANLRDQSIAQMNAQYNMQLKAEDFPTDRFQAKAKNRVLLGLIIRKIVEKAELKPDEAKVQAMIADIAAIYETPEEVVKQFSEDKQSMEGVRSAILEEQVVELILASAQVVTETASYQDAVRPNEKMALDV